jgi:hypothetical protein
MKRLITICAVVGLILAISNMAQALPIVTEYTLGSGTTQWTNVTSAVGSSSLQLNNPASGGSGTYAGVLVTNLGDPKVEDFDSWDYWTKSNAQVAGGYAVSGVNVRIWLDTPYDNYPGADWDVALNIMPHNTLFYEGGNSAQPIPADTWVNLNSLTRYPYQIFAWDGSGNYLGGNDIATQSNAITWSEFQGITSYYAHVDWGTWDYTYDFSQAIIRKISLRTGGGGIITDVTAYLDDFTLNGVSIVVENGFTVVPEPATIALLGLGSLVLLRKRKA